MADNVLIAIYRAEVRDLEAEIADRDQLLAQTQLVQEARRKRLAEFRAALEAAEKEQHA